MKVGQVTENPQWAVGGKALRVQEDSLAEILNPSLVEPMIRASVTAWNWPASSLRSRRDVRRGSARQGKTNHVLAFTPFAPVRDAHSPNRLNLRIHSRRAKTFPLVSGSGTLQYA